MTIDEYIKSKWPADVPADCTRLNHRDLDCLERNAAEWCESCKIYDELYGKAQKYAARTGVPRSAASPSTSLRPT